MLISLMSEMLLLEFQTLKNYTRNYLYPCWVKLVSHLLSPFQARVKWEDIGYSLHLKEIAVSGTFCYNISVYIAHTNISCFRVCCLNCN